MAEVATVGGTVMVRSGSIGRSPRIGTLTRRVLGRGEVDAEAPAAATFVHRSYVAHTEAGRTVPGRRFWRDADEALGAEGALVAGYESAMDAGNSGHRPVADVGQQVTTAVSEPTHDAGARPAERAGQRERCADRLVLRPCPRNRSDG